MANPLDFDDDMARVRQRKSEATAKGGQALLRLLLLAEHHDSGQATRIAGFIASTYNGQVFPFDLYELRLVDEAIADDMLLCIDALRCAGRRPTYIRWCPMATGGQGRFWSSTD